MDHFAGIFLAYQKLGKSKDDAGEGQLSVIFSLSELVLPVEIQQLNAQLAPWTSHDSPGKKRADSDNDTFSVKLAINLRALLSLMKNRFVGVYDTVGSLGRC